MVLDTALVFYFREFCVACHASQFINNFLIKKIFIIKNKKLMMRLFIVSHTHTHTHTHTQREREMLDAKCWMLEEEERDKDLAFLCFCFFTFSLFYPPFFLRFARFSYYLKCNMRMQR